MHLICMLGYTASAQTKARAPLTAHTPQIQGMDGLPLDMGGGLSTIHVGNRNQPRVFLHEAFLIPARPAPNRETSWPFPVKNNRKKEPCMKFLSGSPRARVRDIPTCGFLMFQEYPAQKLIFRLFLSILTLFQNTFEDAISKFGGGGISSPIFGVWGVRVYYATAALQRKSRDTIFRPSYSLIFKLSLCAPRCEVLDSAILCESLSRALSQNRCM